MALVDALHPSSKLYNGLVTELEEAESSSAIHHKHPVPRAVIQKE